MSTKRYTANFVEGAHFGPRSRQDEHYFPFISELKFTILHYYIAIKYNKVSILLILEVCRTRVIYEPNVSP